MSSCMRMGYNCVSTHSLHRLVHHACCTTLHEAEACSFTCLAMKVGKEGLCAASRLTTSANDSFDARTCTATTSVCSPSRYRRCTHTVMCSITARSPKRDSSAWPSVGKRSNADLIGEHLEDGDRHTGCFQDHVEPWRIRLRRPAHHDSAVVLFKQRFVKGACCSHVATCSCAYDFQRNCTAVTADHQNVDFKCIGSCVAHVVRRYQATLVRMEMNSVSALYSTTHSRIWLRHSRIPGAFTSASVAPLEPPSAPVPAT